VLECRGARDAVRPPRRRLHHATHLPKRLVAVDGGVGKDLLQRLSVDFEQLLAGQLGPRGAGAGSERWLPEVGLRLLEPVFFDALAVQTTCVVLLNTGLELLVDEALGYWCLRP
jgi:hypothetical protein